MCRLQPSLFNACLSKRLIPTLLSSKFLVKIDCSHFVSTTKEDCIECVDEDKDGLDLITVYGIDCFHSFI